MKKLLKLSLLGFAISILLAACTPKGQVEHVEIPSEPGPFGKYEQEVTVSAVKVLPSFVKFREGEDNDNNIWTKALKDVLNIKMDYLWIVNNWGEPFDQKVNMMLQTNKLSDVLPLYTSLYMKAVDGEKYTDIKDVFDKYASPKIKALMNRQNGLPFQSVMTEDGKMLAVAAAPSYRPTPDLIWIKQSWLDKLGAKVPETFEEFIDLAYRFAKEDPDGNGKDDTFGLGMHKDLPIGSMYAAFQAPTGIWLKGDDGNLVHGSTIPNVKEPLKILNKMYEDGVIDREFVMKNRDEDYVRDITAGKIGMILGGATMPYASLKEAYEADKVDWIPLTMPSATDKPPLYGIGTNIGTFIGASIHSKQPDAVIKLINFVYETVNGNPEWADGTAEFITTSEGYAASFYSPFLMSDDLAGLEKRAILIKALETNDKSLLYGDMVQTYDQVKAFETNPTTENWSAYATAKVGGSTDILNAWIDEGIGYLSPAYYNETPAWVKSGANLVGKFKEFATNAIVQGNVDALYDDYVKYFNDQGGALATEEISELYRNDPNRIES